MDPMEIARRALETDPIYSGTDVVKPIMLNPHDDRYIDLSVFDDDGKSEDEECGAEGQEDMIGSCRRLKRLSVALKYYETLRFVGRRESSHGLSIFADFIDKVYGQYLDDLQHLKRDHLCDLRVIQRNLLRNEGFHECDGDRCCGTTASTSTSTPSSSTSTASSTSSSKAVTKVKGATDHEAAMRSALGRSFAALHCYLVHPFGRSVADSLSLSKAEGATLHEMVGRQLGEQLFECRLLFRGSRDGFGYDAFWSRCEGHRRSLVVIQTTANRVFGGFTAIGFRQHLNPSNSTWKSGPMGKGSVEDKDAFLFSLRTSDRSKFPPRCFAVERRDRAEAVGYCFGALSLFGGPMGRGIYVDGDCNLATSRNRAYGLGFKGARGYLDEGYGKQFVVKELELFQIRVPGDESR